MADEKLLEFKDWVLEIMDDDNLGVREFARRVGVSHPTISDILAGGKPSLKTVEAIAKYKRMPVSSVLQIAKIIQPPKMGDGADELVHINEMLNRENQEDVLDYAKLKLKKQEKDKKKK